MRSNKCMNQTSSRNSRGNPRYAFSMEEKIVFARSEDEPKTFSSNYQANEFCEKVRDKFPDANWSFASLLKGSISSFNLFIIED